MNLRIESSDWYHPGARVTCPSNGVYSTWVDSGWHVFTNCFFVPIKTSCPYLLIHLSFICERVNQLESAQIIEVAGIHRSTTSLCRNRSTNRWWWQWKRWFRSPDCNSQDDKKENSVVSDTNDCNETCVEFYDDLLSSVFPFLIYRKMSSCDEDHRTLTLSIRLIRSFAHRNIQHIIVRGIDASGVMTGSELKQHILKSE